MVYSVFHAERSFLQNITRAAVIRAYMWPEHDRRFQQRRAPASRSEISQSVSQYQLPDDEGVHESLLPVAAQPRETSTNSTSTNYS